MPQIDADVALPRWMNRRVISHHYKQTGCHGARGGIFFHHDRHLFPYSMRRTVLTLVLLASPSMRAAGQSALHEYRPEVILTSPRVHGFGAQFLYEQHLDAETLLPEERIQGIGVVSPVFLHVRASVEARQVKQGTVVEHRYIPTVSSTVPLGAGFELRNRTRVEVRDSRGTWSQRWQDRTALGHDLDIAGVPVFTYGQFDLSYDSRFRTVNRIEKTAGARIPLVPGSSVDLFFTRQDDTRRATPVLYAIGALLRVAL